MSRVLFALSMERTWASGAGELLHHAQTHLDHATAFDRRIAYLSIDNGVEILLRTFVSLPPRFFGGNGPTREEVESASGSYSRLLELVQKHCKDRLQGIDVRDLEYYHRLRNKLYHSGTGISPDEVQLTRYFEIGKELLVRLLDVNLSEVPDVPRLQRLKPEGRERFMALARDQRRQEKAAKLQAVFEMKKASGILIGRNPKELTPADEALVIEHYERGLSWDKMAHEVSRVRGAFDAVPVEKKKERMVSKALLRRRVEAWIAEGRLNPRQPRRSRDI